MSASSDRLAQARTFLTQVRRRLATPTQIMMRIRASGMGFPFDEASLLRIIAEEEPKVLAEQQRARAEEDRQLQQREQDRLARVDDERHRAEMNRTQQEDALRQKEWELRMREKELELQLREAQLRRMESPPQGFGTDANIDEIYSPDDL